MIITNMIQILQTKTKILDAKIKRKDSTLFCNRYAKCENGRNVYSTLNMIFLTIWTGEANSNQLDFKVNIVRKLITS